MPWYVGFYIVAITERTRSAWAVIGREFRCQNFSVVTYSFIRTHCSVPFPEKSAVVVVMVSVILSVIVAV
jgi:hypothetical protein